MYTNISMKESFLETLHPLTKELLTIRGITKEDEMKHFLFPSYEEHVHDPFLIDGMDTAVKRIVDAIKNSEKIAVYSDYDCDGVPGGVLLRTFFDDIGYPVELYIPHRHNEGYGIHTHAIDALKEKGVTLILTVDLAITNILEIAYAKEKGVDFIVTDHHLPVHKDDGEAFLEKGVLSGSYVIPPAVAVLNSKKDVCLYPDNMLCGCAVAWKLVTAILSYTRKEDVSHVTSVSYETVLEKVKALGEGHEKWYLDLVGISTIADMVPLQKENRVLAHFGLKVLRKTKRLGLNHLFLEQRMRKDLLTEDDIAFTIAPRINAASRMGDPILAHKALYEKDRKLAEIHMNELEELNLKRKSEVGDIVSQISFDHDVYKNDVVVVGDPSWGPGILGLIAQKIIDETKKPVFVWGQGENGEEVKGSCRSLGDVHLVELMTSVGNKAFTHFGGHEGAGGFSLLYKNIETLSPLLNEAYLHVEKKEIDKEDAKADTALRFSDIHEQTYRAIEILAPFGEGNKKPLFAFVNVQPLSVRWFGKKGEHLEVMYEESGKKIKAIQFFAPKDQEEKAKKEHTLLAHFEKSYFMGKTEFRLRVVSFV